MRSKIYQLDQTSKKSNPAFGIPNDDIRSLDNALIAMERGKKHEKTKTSFGRDVSEQKGDFSL